MKQMKNKRIIALALCVATVMSSCLMFSSTTPYDENLLNAAAITRKIFHANLTEEKKEKQKEFGTVAAQYLKGLDDSEDYILAQKNTGGYAIFDKESMELIEYSDEAISRGIATFNGSQ